MASSFLQNLEWRFATKSFDPQKKVSSEDLEKLLTAIRFSPSSYGLQPYHVVVVTNPEVRSKLREAAWNQSQITDSSHLLIFCSRNDTGAHRVDQLLNIMSGGSEEGRQKLAPYENMMRGSFQDMPEEQQKIWADRQTYIALGFGLAAAAELMIDTCPMEGFSPEKFDEILSLPSHLKSVALMAVGYRAAGPEHPKVRFPQEDLLSFVD